MPRLAHPADEARFAGLMRDGSAHTIEAWLRHADPEHAAELIAEHADVAVKVARERDELEQRSENLAALVVLACDAFESALSKIAELTDSLNGSRKSAVRDLALDSLRDAQATLLEDVKRVVFDDEIEFESSNLNTRDSSVRKLRLRIKAGG